MERGGLNDRKDAERVAGRGAVQEESCYEKERQETESLNERNQKGTVTGRRKA